MTLEEAIRFLDREIALLQQARNILAETVPIDAASFIPSSRPAKRRSPLTADGRARIVAAQRARWDKAKQK